MIDAFIREIQTKDHYLISGLHFDDRYTTTTYLKKLIPLIPRQYIGSPISFSFNKLMNQQTASQYSEVLSQLTDFRNIQFQFALHPESDEVLTMLMQHLPSSLVKFSMDFVSYTPDQQDHGLDLGGYRYLSGSNVTDDRKLLWSQSLISAIHSLKGFRFLKTLHIDFPAGNADYSAMISAIPSQVEKLHLTGLHELQLDMIKRLFANIPTSINSLNLNGSFLGHLNTASGEVFAQLHNHINSLELTHCFKIANESGHLLRLTFKESFLSVLNALQHKQIQHLGLADNALLTLNSAEEAREMSAQLPSSLTSIDLNQNSPTRSFADNDRIALEAIKIWLSNLRSTVIAVSLCMSICIPRKDNTLRLTILGDILASASHIRTLKIDDFISCWPEPRHDAQGILEFIQRLPRNLETIIIPEHFNTVTELPVSDKRALALLIETHRPNLKLYYQDRIYPSPNADPISIQKHLMPIYGNYAVVSFLIPFFLQLSLEAPWRSVPAPLSLILSYFVPKQMEYFVRIFDFTERNHSAMEKLIERKTKRELGQGQDQSPQVLVNRATQQPSITTLMSQFGAPHLRQATLVAPPAGSQAAQSSTQLL